MLHLPDFDQDYFEINEKRIEGVGVTETINTKDIELFYDFLNQKETEIRAINGTNVIVHNVKNKEDFLKICKQYNGKAQVYAGINERKAGLIEAGSAEDVIKLQRVVIDIVDYYICSVNCSDLCFFLV